MTLEKTALKLAIQECQKTDYSTQVTKLLKVLGYKSSRTLPIDSETPGEFLRAFDLEEIPNRPLAKFAQWKAVKLLFQLTDEELNGSGQFSFDNEVIREEIQSYLFVSLDITGEKFTRTELANITREINRGFMLPVFLIMRYADQLTIGIVHRRPNKKIEGKDVLEKVTLIKDICINDPHRGHIEILYDLALENLGTKVTSFSTLHAKWQEILNTSELNKRFYKEIANWYFWAFDKVRFPEGAGKEKEIRNATSLIRLITRLIFIWFLKEKGLVPEALFDEDILKSLLTWKDQDKSTYYKAVLQNLFFATLNQEMNTPENPNRREFRKPGSNYPNENYLVTTLYRHETYFSSPNREFIELTKDIPFLNGGLFECLDKKNDKGEVIRIDGFSDVAANEPEVPDDLFFSTEIEVDLNTIFDTNNKKYAVRGILNILNSYKFTIEENTPLEEDVALDPELLGKVFENLLAAYNPETRTTARKQTGSFYTPREIVNYMVDETLVVYFKTKLASFSTPPSKEELEKKIRILLSHTHETPKFSEEETNTLINAIDNIKVLDPACGSGAFPMGVLHQLVNALSKLDPNNELWLATQIERAKNAVSDLTLSERIEEIKKTFNANERDYARKLFLIQNCIYGVDVQPIAVQIAKLRFFISLVADQKVNNTEANRGIIPLPNLETNFVAANTLLGLNTEKRESQSSFKTLEVVALEDELKKIRKQLFSVRKSWEKNHLRGEDKKLRTMLGKVLSDTMGMTAKDSLSLATWDPYDQNASSDFFDPEWMFEINSGFDIVIGNPPYINSRNMSKDDETIRILIQSTYKMTKGSWDIYIAFYEKGFNLLNQTGALSYITPDKWIAKPFGDVLRINTVNNIYSIMKAGRSIFESANVDAIVTVFKKENESDLMIYSFVDNVITFLGTKNKLTLHSPYTYDSLFSDYEGLLSKVDHNVRKFSDYGLCENACATDDAYRLRKHIIDNPTNNVNAAYLKIINTGTILKYVSRWGFREMVYLGSRYIRPVINRENFLKDFPNTYGQKSIKPKLIVKGLNLLDACIDNEGSFIPGIPTLIVTADSIRKLKFLLALVNCKLMFFYIKEKYPSSSYNQGTTFTKEMINSFPMPQIPSGEFDDLVNNINSIIEIKLRDINADITEYETKNNKIFYELYDLTIEEIAIVERRG